MSQPNGFWGLCKSDSHYPESMLGWTHVIIFTKVEKIRKLGKKQEAFSIKKKCKNVGICMW